MIDPGEAASLTAAQTGDEGAFKRLTEPYRRELTVHGYRMLGSLQDAEDLLQETLLRAWRRLETFQQNVSFRAWLYKIATNLCLDRLDKRPRRSLPALVGQPSDPQGPMAPPSQEPIWLEPIPGEWLISGEGNPETLAVARETISLAFLVALQQLPPRQRAVLILCDVLDWRAGETAELLGLTVSSVNSALHRARSTLKRFAGQEAPGAPPPIAENERIQSLLSQYMDAWESQDIPRLVALLKEDAEFTMPPTPTWFQGRSSIAAFIEREILRPHSPPDIWRLVPTQANGQPALAVYLRTEAGGPFKAITLQVLTMDPALRRIDGVTCFLNTDLFRRFQLPAEVV